MHLKHTQDGCGDYYDLLEKVIKFGNEVSNDRTGVGTVSLFGEQMRFNLQHGFPLVTGKEINYRAVFNEFLWMVVHGSTDVTWLEERGHKFWSAWKLDDGTIGPGYGHQFRRANNVDQVRNVIDGILSNPESRRHIISLWNPADIESMALPPCHGNIIQFDVFDGELSCLMYQRSADIFVGLPWNIAFYALMTHVFAHLTGLKVGELIVTIGNAHIYLSHLSQTRELLARDLGKYSAPILRIKRKVESIDDFVLGDFDLIDYHHHPKISAPVAV